MLNSVKAESGLYSTIELISSISLGKLLMAELLLSLHDKSIKNAAIIIYGKFFIVLRL